MSNAHVIPTLIHTGIKKRTTFLASSSFLPSILSIAPMKQHMSMNDIIIAVTRKIHEPRNGIIHQNNPIVTVSKRVKLMNKAIYCSGGTPDLHFF